MSSPTPQKVNVKSIISIFENQSIAVNNEPATLLRRAKSLGSLNYRTIRTEPEQIIRIEPKQITRAEPQRTFKPENNLEVSQIEQQIQHLQNTLNHSYKSYSRETHIYCQNQIVFILTDVGSLDTKGNPKTINKKSELTESLKRLNKKLNALLPSGTSVTRPQPISSTNAKIPVNTRPENVVVSRSKSSVEAKREIHVQKKEKRVQKVEPKEDEVDAPALSVKTLKELFEKNSTENEGKTEFGSAKLPRKSLTFNGTSDLKYVPYNQRLQSATQELDTQWNSSSIKKENSMESSGSSIKNENSVESSTETLESYFSSKQVTNGSEGEDEEQPENLTPDSLLSEGSGSSSSSEESDGEASERENLEEEN